MYMIYTVAVMIPSGKTIGLYIYHPYTIEEVRQEISRREGIPPHCQQLTFTGRVLEDGHALTDYNMQYGSKLDLMVRHGSKYIYVSFSRLCNNVVVLNPASIYPDTKGDYIFPGDTAFIYYWAYQVYDSRKERSSF